MDLIMNRILEDLGDKELIEKLTSMPKSDFNSLLLTVFQMQTNNISPVDIIKAFELNRFSVPSEIDPIQYHNLEVELLSLAQKEHIKPILLSPSAPLGSCSAFGCVDQNNVISATRNSEMLADPTNMLSLIITNKLKSKELDNKDYIHYCATARVLRAKPLPKAKGVYSHFGLFNMVSSGKDSGSYNCEKDLIIKHLTYYKKLLSEKYTAKLSITLRKRSGYTDNDGFFNRMTELIKSEFPDIPISFDLEHEDNNYYKGINFKIFMEKDGELFEIGDGGFVDWIKQMTTNNKERCLISAIALDRLLLL